jgi:hypothetical protein
MAVMSFAGEIVRRFAQPDGAVHYSICRRSDGLFQIVYDGAKLADGLQPYWMEDRVFTGIYETADFAEDELQRQTGGEWVRVS